MILKWLYCWLILVAFLWALNKGVTCKLSSFQAITMSSEAVCCEYCTVCEQRPFSQDQIEIYGRMYDTHIYISTYRQNRCTSRKCGAHSGSPQIHIQYMLGWCVWGGGAFHHYFHQRKLMHTDLKVANTDEESCLLQYTLTKRELINMTL